MKAWAALLLLAVVALTALLPLFYEATPFEERPSPLPSSASQPPAPSLSYDFTESCSANYTPYVEVREADGLLLLSGRIVPNCCSDELKVVANRSGDVVHVYLLELDFDGLLCRCICPKDFKVIIRGQEPYEGLSILWVAVYGGEVRSVKVLYEGMRGFCGRSTYGRCRTDLDCVRDGCSGEVCRSVLEDPVITPCIWRECYDVRKYKAVCSCVNGMCQWILAG